MTDAQIETQRVAGDLILVLRDGTEQERASLLRAIERLCGNEERERIETWMREGMPDVSK